MHFTKVSVCLSSLIILVLAQEPGDAALRPLSTGRMRTPTSNNKLMPRDLEKRCSGTCAECFGDGYTQCPGSALYCYLPGDSTYGLDSCPGESSGSPTSTADTSIPTSTGVSGIDDICSQKGATCVSCFGPGYLQCPDGYHCYDPSDPNYSTCPDDGTGGSGGGGGGSSSGGSTTASSCADQYGTGSVPCGTDACYNPTEGDICCADGCE